MISCPYCNHAFASEAANQCPRCGEAIRASTANAIMARESAQVVELGSFLVRRVKQALIAAALIVVALIAIAVWITSRDKPAPAVPPPSPLVNVSAPLELRGLAHLPSRANIVFAVQPGPLLAYAEKTKQDPVELLTRNRVPAALLGSLAKAGLTLQHIDHIVGGAYVPDKNEEIRFGLVLVLRQKPADEKAFLDAFKAVPAPTLGQGRFTVDIGGIALNAFHASETVWVFSLSEKDVASPSPLHAELRSLIEERVPKDAAIWAAAAGERWHEKPLAAFLRKDAIAKLSQGRAAAFGYSFGETPTLRLAVRTSDAPSGEKLRAKFRELATGEFSIASGSGEWAELARPVEPADAFATVKRMLE